MGYLSLPASTISSSFCLREASLYLFSAAHWAAWTQTEGVTIAVEWLAFKERSGGGSGGETKYPRIVPTPSQWPSRHDVDLVFDLDKQASVGSHKRVEGISVQAFDSGGDRRICFVLYNTSGRFGSNKKLLMWSLSKNIHQFRVYWCIFGGFGTMSGLNWFSIIHNPICARGFTCDLLFDSFSSLRRNQASNLALLIAQMQKNADQVEKDILRSEELLAVVRTLHSSNDTSLLLAGPSLKKPRTNCCLLPSGFWTREERSAFRASDRDIG